MTSVLLLRGINVGGYSKLAMAELRTLPEGLSTSKIPAKAERLLGSPMTARNFSTVAKLAEMLDAP
ncbi:DUF1697 domain-containing protein [Oceanicola sp. D3]|uniref:DUF1697 domain-containing protein n=1 Tax=Oceanicola sp. D3 TaxID=2587163 RepID=UPI001AEF4E20|nr:DUF1697 domain-containing protein [Oceanicola sp. D3]